MMMIVIIVPSSKAVNHGSCEANTHSVIRKKKSKGLSFSVHKALTCGYNGIYPSDNMSVTQIKDQRIVVIFM